MTVIRRSICCILLGLLAGRAIAAEVGQYRSRVQVDPAGRAEQGRVLSVAELERQIDGIDDPYAKSSAGRHLARHYVEQKEYDKAVDYYRTALAARGLSEIANREMLRELAQVYMLKEDYRAAAATLEHALAIDMVPAAGDYLLLARAHYQRRDYVAVVAALDRIDEKGLRLDIPQTRQALALYYRAGAWAQCETLLKRLLEMEPNNPEHWHQLTAVYLQQNKKRRALDQLALAREKGVPFREADLLLLVDLKAVNGNPYGAAETLAQGLQSGELSGDAASYRKLFELWFQAREKDRAGAALVRAAGLSGDTELYLYLAQLQMEQESWSAMHQTMLAACAGQLQDRHVSRANLYLGVSQLKLGDRDGARRSFINATLIGGANVQAGQWLDFMAAEPATENELRRIEGPCYGTEGKRRSVAGITAANGLQVAEGITDTAAASFQFRNLPAQRLFYTEHEVPLQELAPKIRSLATRMGVSLVKAGGSVDGPLQVISPSGVEGILQLALPVRGVPQARGQYRLRLTEPSRVAYMAVKGEGGALASAAADLARRLQEAGYELTGERRLVFPGAGSGEGEAAEVELQLGVVP